MKGLDELIAGAEREQKGIEPEFDWRNEPSCEEDLRRLEAEAEEMAAKSIVYIPGKRPVEKGGGK